jgi:hypothetical protein
MNNNEQELLIYIRELETKLEEKEKQLNIYEGILEKFDSNLKLSIQSSQPASKIQSFQKVITSKLFETIEKNLNDVSDETIRSLLEEPHPATAQCVKILVKTLQNENNSHAQLLVATTNTFCKYMNNEEEIVLGNISTVFDNICKKVYNRCKPVIIDLCFDSENQLINSNMSEVELNKDNYRCDNIMMFSNTRFKAKLLKEIMPMIR